MLSNVWWTLLSYLGDPGYELATLSRLETNKTKPQSLKKMQV